MYNIIISGEISTETLEKFTDEVNNAVEKENITVYLSSTGGNLDLVPVFRDIIEKHQMKLVSFEVIYSAALTLFLTTKTPRKVLEGTTGLFHSVLINNTTIDKNGKPTAPKDLLKVWKNTNDEGYLPHLFGMTKKDLKKMRKGKDFYFDDNAVREALKKSNELFGILKKKN